MLLDTLCDGAEAIWQIFANLYQVFLDGLYAAWPEIRRLMSTVAWAYVSGLRLIFYVFLSPLVVIVSILGVPVWLLEWGVVLADLILARLD